MQANLLAFLERLLGEPVSASETIVVSSTQRARLVAWLNDHSVPATFDHFKSNLIRVSDLLSGSTFSPAPQDEGQRGAVHSPSNGLRAGVGLQAEPRHRGALMGVGIDIQRRSSMPEVVDFRGDGFYVNNFSPRELAHCIEAGDPIMSLAGLWAAKEAIIKAGAAPGQLGAGLAAVEIGHDPSGSPQYPNCFLSISHDSDVAVAVCVHVG